MAKPVRVTITGPTDDRIDAPTAEDFLAQVRDLLDVLRGVEKAVESDGASELVWRVTDATMNSPISLELTPYGLKPQDAVHVASAIVWSVPVLHSFDTDLLKLDKLLSLADGNQLRIVRPTEEDPTPDLFMGLPNA